ncbi:glycosyltransferase family 2 protein [Bipolaris oryzae ATCC 44560]|uniref:Glycosyltransferase family 2 protein n=1 Tax=Bipolaris oryzae ATCC 44560 TaxID=930090 RepID=W6Z1A6_COCMI|nr:glycosyltransferase family 2 protein [Bipolaris oryzae ATCC 44560]EUC43493.1 glycosyltransferase family 2 protein [Bipolaris oryzae ATCC 44560]
MPLEPGMKHFIATFTLVPMLWLWWLSILPNTASLGVNAVWNYNPSDPSIFLATSLVVTMALWILHLVLTMKARGEPVSPSIVFGLTFHTVPALCLLAAVLKSKMAQDTQLVWFSALIALRYWRTLVAVFFWTRYTPSVRCTYGAKAKYAAEDCTVVVATVGPGLNLELFTRMVEGILANRPKRIVFSTPEAGIADIVRPIVLGIQKVFDERRVGGGEKEMDGCYSATEIVVTGEANKKDKRTQTAEGIKMVDTEIMVMADDSAVWPPKLLEAALPAFQDDKVGFVGTRKWVERLPLPEYDAELNWFQNLVARYRAGFWNTIGALYLVRHNFEIRASNAADGGVFCVSGRTSLILSRIVKDEGFVGKFLNEYIWSFPSLGVEGVGPLKADDDNFITRWVINHGMDVKIQYTEDATMTTQLGRMENFKFVDQCMRWSRTTIRQNPIVLFVDLTVWWKWPISVWMVYFPWMYNAALFWDTLAVWTFTTTAFFRDSSVKYYWLGLLISLIWMSKLTKTIPWFMHMQNRLDFFWYFFPIPAYPLFAYAHSIIKIYTVATFWVNDWSGRTQDEKQPELDGIKAK